MTEYIRIFPHSGLFTFDGKRVGLEGSPTQQDMTPLAEQADPDALPLPDELSITSVLQTPSENQDPQPAAVNEDSVPVLDQPELQEADQAPVEVKPSEEGDQSATVEDYTKMSVKKLQALCRRMNLKTQGTKQDLVARVATANLAS